MNCTALQGTGAFRVGTAAWAVCWLASLIFPALGWADDEDESIYLLWQIVSAQRARGEFDRAIEVLVDIIRDTGSSTGVLRRAYNHLVFTHQLKSDPEGAQRYAREGLERFPDLTADPVEFPPRVNATYEALRGAMFGSLAITKPVGGEVSLDGEARGLVPLVLEYVRAGEHELVVRKPRHNDHAERIAIEPGVRHSFELSLERQRDTRWWLYRIGPAALVVAGAILLLRDDPPPPDVVNPLPAPPDPPAR
jgi:hypothetical protein